MYRYIENTVLKACTLIRQHIETIKLLLSIIVMCIGVFMTIGCILYGLHFHDMVTLALSLPGMVCVYCAYRSILALEE